MRVRIPYLLMKRLKGGRHAYYWSPPRHMMRPGLSREALGTEEGPAVLRASELNALLSAILDETAEPARGSVRWGIGLYEGDDEYRDLKESTQRVYSQSLVRISARFGRWPIKGIDYRNAKQFYRDERAPQRAGEKERLGQANNTLRVARLVWEYFIREEHAAGNPFRKVRLSSLPSRKALWTRSQVDSFIAAADRLACPEIGTAVLLAFELCQRQGDILSLTWEQIAGNRITIRQNKTDALVWIPLDDLPELVARLRVTPRRGGKIIADPDGRGWNTNAHQFRKVVRRVAQVADIPDTLTFMDLRRSGLTELGNAGATDDEIRSISGHLTREVVKAYVLPNDVQAAHALEKRRKGRG